MLPVIALVGRPNVGKSTLFNVLTGTRDAIVADVPGLTRDRQYGYGRLGPVPCVVIDTGGLIENPTGIEAQMRAQTERAVAEADRLVFLADARAGLSPQDHFVARELRRPWCCLRGGPARPPAAGSFGGAGAAPLGQAGHAGPQQGGRARRRHRL